MSFHINTWIEGEESHFQLLDSESKAVCVSWSYKTKGLKRDKTEKDIQRLFRDLLLLTCKQDFCGNGPLSKG